VKTKLIVFVVAQTLFSVFFFFVIVLPGARILNHLMHPDLVGLSGTILGVSLLLSFMAALVSSLEILSMISGGSKPRRRRRSP
jgi:hypothetical protein